MSTTIEEPVLIDAHAHSLSSAILNVPRGVFGDLRPQQWRLELRNAMPETCARILAEARRRDIANMDDTQVGEFFVQTLDNVSEWKPLGGSNNHEWRDNYRAFGIWLKQWYAANPPPATESIAPIGQTSVEDLEALLERCGTSNATEFNADFTASYSQWGAHPREAWRRVMTELLQRRDWRNDLPVDIGTWVFERMDQIYQGQWIEGSTRNQKEVMGQWLLDNTSVRNPNVEKPGVPTDWPMHSFPRIHGALMTWSENDIDDVLDSVDAQAAALSNMRLAYHDVPGYGDGEQAPWATNDPWFTSGPAKGYLGALMDYKRFRLRGEVRDANAPEVLPDDPEELKRLLQEARDAHTADIERISARFTREANDRAWCSEYDSIINGLNTEMTVKLTGRPRIYRARYTEVYTVTVTRDETVEGASQGEARRAVEGETGSYRGSDTARPMTGRRLAEWLYDNYNYATIEREMAEDVPMEVNHIGP